MEINQSMGVPERPYSADSLVGDSIREGWETFKARPGIMIGMLVLLMVIAGIGQAIITQMFGSDIFTLQATSQAFSLITTVFSAGVYFTAVKIVRREEVQFGLFTSGFAQFVPILVAYIVMIIAIVIGVILLVIPGIILALGLSQWVFIVMDKELGGVESLKASWEMMKGYKLKYFGFVLLLGLINIAGALALAIGLLVTLPLSIYALASFYNRVLALNGGAVSVPTVE